MPLPRALLDTDTLSAVMRGTPPVLAKARDYLAEHGTFSFSIITRYEILRGLKAKNAIVQLRAFDRLCAGSQIVPLTDGAVVKASEIYAELRRRGGYPARKDLPPFRRARRRGSRGGIY